MIKRAISLKPDSDDSAAYTILGSIQLKKDSLEEARDAYRLAIKIDEKTSEAHYGLALIYIRLGDKESAISEYNILKKSETSATKSALIDLKRRIDQM